MGNPISYVTILRNFCGFNHINNPCVFADTWISISTSSETADWRTLLAHCPSNTGMTPGLSLVVLFFSLSPFNSSLKVFQWALLSPAQFLFPLWDKHTQYYQQAWCRVDQLMNRKPTIQSVTAGSESGIGGLFFLFLPPFLEGWRRTLLVLQMYNCNLTVICSDDFLFLEVSMETKILVWGDGRSHIWHTVRPQNFTVQVNFAPEKAKCSAKA